MSMTTCDRCCAYVDSDWDVECFIGDTSTTLCERCRDRLLLRGELIEAEDGTLQFAPIDAVETVNEVQS